VVINPILKLLLLGKKVFKYYTSGYENVLWVDGYKTGSGDRSKEADHLYLKSYGQAGIVQIQYVTGITVNLNNIKTLFIDWENVGSSSNNQNAHLIVSTTQSASTAIFDARVSIDNVFPRTITSLDVSALSGQYYIRVAARTASSGVGVDSIVNVYCLWGEK
jgi:hypothetical protein